MNRSLVDYSPETELLDLAAAGARETAWPGEDEAEGLDEAATLELAVELMEVAHESELDRFIGRLIDRAGRAAGRFVRSPAGQALGSLLKSAARQALPIVADAMGGPASGVQGTQAGARVAAAGSQVFGLELEGLSPEDREFELAKGFVRFAGAAVTNAIAAPYANLPRANAQQAVREAARRHAPGLLRSFPSPNPRIAGRWIRSGRHLIVLM